MRRLWLFPLMILIILLLAAQFRWEKGPTQTEDGYCVVHLLDRWTGQSWYSLYGGIEVKEGKEVTPYYSGELIPHPDKESLAVAIDEYLQNKEDIAAKKQAIEEKLAEAKREIESNTEGHLKYLELQEEIRKSRTFFSETASGSGAGGPTIPTEVIAAHRAWEEAEQRVETLHKELQTLLTEAEAQAVKALREKAVFINRLVTGAWLILLIISLMVAVNCFILERQHSNRISESFEVIEYHIRNDRNRGSERKGVDLKVE